MVCIYTLNHTLIWVKGSRFNSGHIWPLCVGTPFPRWTVHFRLNWLLMFQKPTGWILYSRRQSITGKRVQVFYQQIKKLDQISLQLIAEKRKFKLQVWLMKAIRRRVPQRTVSGRHKWISSYAYAEAYCSDRGSRTLDRCFDCCTPCPRYATIDMRQNVRDQESQVSLAWPRVVGTLSKDDDDGSENVGKNDHEFAFFQT